MANEITITNTLQVLKRNTSGSLNLVQYQGQPNTFRADMTGSSGPYVGTVYVQQTYTTIDLSRVGTPGLCRIQNQDATNLVEVGIWNPAGNDFIPFMELLPGESYVFRLSRYMGQNLVPGTGTGTGDTNINYLAAKASGSACQVLFEVFPQ